MVDGGGSPAQGPCRGRWSTCFSRLGWRSWAVVIGSALLVAGTELAADLMYAPDRGAEALGSVAPMASDAWRLAENLSDLSVRVERAGKTLRLKRKRSAFHSRLLPGWNWVGPVSATLKEGPALSGWPLVRPGKPDQVETACLWAHPVDDAKLVLSFGAAPAAGELQLLLGYLRTAASGASVRVEVRRGGVVLGRESFSGGPGDVRLARIPLVPGAESGRPAPLEIVIEPAKRGKNHLCLDGLVRAPSSGGEVAP